MPNLDELINYYIENEKDCETVKGLVYEVDADELSTHAKARAEHHVKKADLFTKQVDELRGSLDDMPKPASGKAYSNSNSDPVETLAENARHHRNRAAYFAWIADHFVDGAMYRLSESDLTLLELKR